MSRVGTHGSPHCQEYTQLELPRHHLLVGTPKMGTYPTLWMKVSRPHEIRSFQVSRPGRHPPQEPQVLAPRGQNPPPPRPRQAHLRDQAVPSPDSRAAWPAGEATASRSPTSRDTAGPPTLQDRAFPCSPPLLSHLPPLAETSCPQRPRACHARRTQLPTSLPLSHPTGRRGLCPAGPRGLTLPQLLDLGHRAGPLRSVCGFQRPLSLDTRHLRPPGVPSHRSADLEASTDTTCHLSCPALPHQGAHASSGPRHPPAPPPAVQARKRGPQRSQTGVTQ